MMSKSGHSRPALPPCAVEAGFDRADVPATAYRIDFSRHAGDVASHHHRQGQLIVALHGAVTCITATRLWIVPPGHAVWIPGGTSHANRATPDARLAYLFVEPGAADLPDRCCAISVSVMVREMILRLADLPDRHAPSAPALRLMRVLLDELSAMPPGGLELPVSEHPKIVAIAAALAARPDDRATLGKWAGRVAMSERALRRLVLAETGLPFGQWRRRLQVVVALQQLGGGARVQQVAAALGYASTTAFIAMFKKVLGITPARYFGNDRRDPVTSDDAPDRG